MHIIPAHVGSEGLSGRWPPSANRWARAGRYPATALARQSVRQMRLSDPDS
jgi:hypothetical protein